MSELTVLAHELAWAESLSWLLSNTNSVELDGHKWMDVDGDLDGVPLGIAFKKEIRYLTLRSALCWHPLKPNLMRIIEK
jgi:hypothetical protein